MRNINDLFDEYLDKLESAIGLKRFSNCYRMCDDLTKYSTMSDYKDGILISEILENIFSELRDLFKSADIPETEEKQILTDLKTHIALIQTTYKDDDKNSIYNALREIRSITTRFQIHCYNTFSIKPVPLHRRMEQIL